MRIVSHLSGGFDSLASTLMELEAGHEVKGFFIDYGQSYAEQERRAVYKIESLLARNFPLWRGMVVRTIPLEIQSTTEVDFYVPMRNLVLIAMAVNLACVRAADAVSVGMYTLKRRPDDPYCFRDASIPFISLLQATIDEASEDGTKISLRMPLVTDQGRLSKKQILEKVLQYMPLETCWNCFSSEDVPCRKCFHCEQRLKIQAELGI